MMAFVLRMLGLLPLPVLYALGSLIAFVAHRVMRWHVPLARDNIARSLPELSAIERREILARSYRNLGVILAEGIWGWRADADALRRRVTIDDRALIDRYIVERRNVVLLGAHVCNWEWLMLAACAELDVPICPVYKPLRLSDVDEYVRAARARFGGRPIAVDNLLFELMRVDDEPRAYAMLADQTPPENGPKEWRHFLHQDTAFYTGVGKIARYLDAPVLYVAMRRVRRGVYTAHFSVLSEPPYHDDPEEGIVDRYAARLEAEIRVAPENWLWVHRKWKYPKPPEA